MRVLLLNVPLGYSEAPKLQGHSKYYRRHRVPRNRTSLHKRHLDSCSYRGQNEGEVVSPVARNERNWCYPERLLSVWICLEGRCGSHQTDHQIQAFWEVLYLDVLVVDARYWCYPEKKEWQYLGTLIAGQARGLTDFQEFGASIDSFLLCLTWNLQFHSGKFQHPEVRA